MEIRQKTAYRLIEIMSDRLCPLKEAAQDAPHQLAYLSKEDSLTFAQLDQTADAFAAHLLGKGIRPGDRIAVFHPSDWRLIALFFAAWRLGAALSPLNLRSPPSLIETSLARLSPALFLTDLDFPLASTQAAPFTTANFDAGALLLFTSGSTGIPKIASLSLANLVANAAAAIAVLDLRPNDQWLLSLPLFHVGGIGIVIRSVLARATIVLDERSPSITHLSYVPTHLFRSTPLYRKLRCLLLGGSSVCSYPPQLPVFVTYGLTEMSSMVAARFRPSSKGGIFYLGPPLQGKEIRIGSDGEIWVRGDSLFQGYWEAGQLKTHTDLNGWFATGDLGSLCPREGLAITGRKDWQFISGGENIQPEEIERELLLLPGVSEAIVVPLPDPEFGHRPAAAIQCTQTSPDLQKIQTALHLKLPRYKVPIALVLFDELPKNGMKADRKKIFEILSAKRFK